MFNLRFNQIGCGAKLFTHFFLVIACSTETLAHSAELIDRGASYEYKDCDSKQSSFSFPFFEGGDDAASARVNEFLYVRFLEIAPPAKRESATRPLQAESWVNGDARELMSRIQFTNMKRVLTVVVSFDSCVAFGGFGKASYSFDARSGRLLVERELFTEEGRVQLGHLLFNNRARAVKQKISLLEKQGRAHAKGGTAGRIQSSIDLYTKCMSDRFSSSRLSDLHGATGLMTIGDGTVSFSASACSTQADAAYDDMGEFNNAFESATLEKYLSAYGKYVLLGEGTGEIASINPYAQFFHGRINNTAFTLFLGASNPQADDAFGNATYYYDKYRQLIPLSVDRKGNIFVLTESKSPDPIKPVLKFKIESGKLVGEWKSAVKTYPLLAVP